MSLYDIWFQSGHIMMTIEARNNQEAREEFNRWVSVKKRDVNHVKEKVEVIR